MWPLPVVPGRTSVHRISQLPSGPPRPGDTVGIPANNPAEHTKYLAYPQTNKLSSSQASYDAKTGVITLNVPRADVGNPANGSVLYSATAFSATSLTPQSATTLFNLTDATTPFELVVGAPGTVGSAPSAPPPLPPGFYHPRPGCPQATGRLTQAGVGPLSLGMKRARARAILTHSSTRGRRYMDFFCLKPVGIRAAYPSPAMLRGLTRKVRGRLSGRIVLLLTSDRLYALRGVRPGARLSKVGRRLHVGRQIRIGLNDWYLAPNGRSIGVLKVRHGVIEEIGIADLGLTAKRRTAVRFLKSFG